MSSLPEILSDQKIFHRWQPCPFEYFLVCHLVRPGYPHDREQMSHHEVIQLFHTGYWFILSHCWCSRVASFTVFSESTQTAASVVVWYWYANPAVSLCLQQSVFPHACSCAHPIDNVISTHAASPLTRYLILVATPVVCCRGIFQHKTTSHFMTNPFYQTARLISQENLITNCISNQKHLLWVIKIATSFSLVYTNEITFIFSAWDTT